ncbi:MAG: NepR family anti-sigma factor [Geminicoccaceae bacterium]
MSKRADKDNGDAGKVSSVESDEVMLERGFDRWLNRQLHRIYDPVLSEAVPDEIMRLLEEFETTPPKPEHEDD